MADEGTKMTTCPTCWGQGTLKYFDDEGNLKYKKCPQCKGLQEIKIVDWVSERDMEES